MSPNFIPEGIGLLSIDEDKKWEVKILVREGEYLKQVKFLQKFLKPWYYP